MLTWRPAANINIVELLSPEVEIRTELEIRTGTFIESARGSRNSDVQRLASPQAEDSAFGDNPAVKQGFQLMCVRVFVGFYGAAENPA